MQTIHLLLFVLATFVSTGAAWTGSAAGHIVTGDTATCALAKAADTTWSLTGMIATSTTACSRFTWSSGGVDFFTTYDCVAGVYNSFKCTDDQSNPLACSDCTEQYEDACDANRPLVNMYIQLDPTSCYEIGDSVVTGCESNKDKKRFVFYTLSTPDPTFWSEFHKICATSADIVIPSPSPSTIGSSTVQSNGYHTSYSSQKVVTGIFLLAMWHA